MKHRHTPYGGLRSAVACAVASLAAATALAACGSTAAKDGAQTNPGPDQAARDTLAYARCMRSHGVPGFPDDLDYQSISSINPSSPAFERAQAGCRHLLPVKTAPAASPSARTEARMVRLTECLRTHGYADMPDPRPNPPPAGGSPGADNYSALFGEGDYWIGIPKDVNAHGAAFIHALHLCHANP